MSPRYLLALFIAVTVVSAGALGWLGWRLLQQDRALESQRIQERRENAVELAAAALQKGLSEVEEQLIGFSGLPAAALAQKLSELADDLTLVAFSIQEAPSAKEPPAEVFAAAEALEFQQKEPARAIAALEELARSPNQSVRAGALVRLGRNLRKAGRFEEALKAYDKLAGLGTVPAGGAPAELVGRQARCAVLEQQKDQARLRQEASALYADLLSGRWPLSRAALEFYGGEAARWVGGPQANGLAAVMESLWEEREKLAAKGTRSARAGERLVLVVWRRAGDRVVAMVVGPGYAGSHWLPATAGVRIALGEGDGRAVAGLPWTIQATAANGSAAVLTARRRLLLAVLCVIAVLVMGGSYLIGRAVTRELAVARLQSDFVSAVSHEFRSPLTVLRQMSEGLAKGRVPSEETRQQYYEVMERESGRLQRLVEALLNFGRMEAGAARYRLEPLDPAELVRSVVAEFQQEASGRGCRIECSTNGAAPMVRADREALGRALWNLLDNAVKYSPDCPTVWVDLAAEGERVAIRVRDRGLGIPKGEQKEIFKKFVRGAGSDAAEVKGTGIGLAMVEHVVRAHGGRVEVESQPGEGSTFTVWLPKG